MYKHTLYRLDTKYGCGGVRVGETGYINETCPLYRWMQGKRFREVMDSLKRGRKLIACHKITVEYDPF